MTRREIARSLSLSESKISSPLLKTEDFKSYQDRYISTEHFDKSLADIISRLESYHKDKPLGKGLSRDEVCQGDLAIDEFVLAAALQMGLVKNQGELWQLAGHQAALDQEDEKQRALIREIFLESPFSPPALPDLQSSLDEKGRTILQWMVQHGDLVRIEKDFFLLSDQLEQFMTALKTWFREHEELTVGDLREIIPTTRKYLLPLLNYAERKALLMRDGDIRRWVGEELS